MFKSEIIRDSLPDLDNGFYLWVWYADKVPPHIGCSLNGEYFSLKVSGKDLELPVKKVMELVQRKGIAFLLIDVEAEFSKSNMDQIFSLYDHANCDRSCLTPILDLFGNPTGVDLLVDLLAHLEQNDRIKCIFGLNLPEGYNGIPVYSTEEVKSRLLKLNRAEKQVDISKVS